ncbi:MAG TPA: polysaccharide deacetylase family protein [Desulfobacterales bacterium]
MKPDTLPKRLPTGAAPPKVILSIHDVSPGSLPAVQEILATLTPRQIEHCTLLVIPGSGWTPPTLDVLRELQRRGCMLAGHGWCHRSIAPRTLYHRFHSHLASRDVAEHLSRRPATLISLIQRCYDWFVTAQLPLPELYVPPAWAMGALTKPMLNTLPFAMVEYTTGVYHKRRKMFLRLPLVGFEADTPLRTLLLRGWNFVNKAVAGLSGRPLRVAIHPFDLQFRLAASLRRLLAEHRNCCTYDKVVTQNKSFR